MSSPIFLINLSAPHSGPQMEWISSTLSENNHTFLVVACGMKSPRVASCGLMCPQNHTCRGLTRMFSLQKIASRSEDYSDFRHFRQGFKQNSKVRRLGGILRLPNTGTAPTIRSQSEATAPTRGHFKTSNSPILGRCLKPASRRLQVRFPNTGTVLEASLKSASRRLQMRFPNTGTGFEAERDLGF